MKIYKVTPRVYLREYDYFDQIMVIAENENEARTIHPDENVILKDGKWVCEEFGFEEEYDNNRWIYASEINGLIVEKIGDAEPYLEKGVIMTSYING